MSRLAMFCLMGALALAGARTADADHNCRYGQNARCRVRATPIPMSDVAFKNLRTTWPTDVFAATALYVYALIALHENPAIGEQLLLLATHESQLKKGARKSVYKGWGWAGTMAYQMRRLAQRACFPGYAANATERNGAYAVKLNHVELELRTQREFVPTLSSGRARVWVCPINRDCFALGLRHVYLQQSGTRVKAWKVDDARAAFSGCRSAAR